MLVRTRVLIVALIVAVTAAMGAIPVSAGSASATPAPIKVGLICSCSGNYGSAFVVGQDSFLAWVATTNASGGINGHKIDVITEDDGGLPAKGISEAQTLVSDGVVAVVDNVLTDTTWIPMLETADIPALGGPGTQSISQVNFPVATSIGGSSIALTVSLLQAALKNVKPKNIGDLYCVETSACSATLLGLKSASAKAGIRLVYSEGVSATAPNYTAQCLAAKSASVSALLLGGQPSTTQTIIRDCNLQGYYPIFLPPNVPADATLVKNNKFYVSESVYPYVDQKLPAMKDAFTAFNKHYPGVLTQAGSPIILVPEFWAVGIMLHDALTMGGLTASNTPTKAQVIKGLYSFKGNTLQGITAPLTFQRGTAHRINCSFGLSVIHGTYGVANGGHANCAAGVPKTQ